MGLSVTDQGEDTVGTTAKAKYKSEARYIADGSNIADAAMLVGAAFSYFVPGDPSTQQGDITNFQKLIMNIAKIPVVPVLQENIINIDATTIVAQDVSVRHSQHAPNIKTQIVAKRSKDGTKSASWTRDFTRRNPGSASLLRAQPRYQPQERMARTSSSSESRRLSFNHPSPALTRIQRSLRLWLMVWERRLT